MPSAPGCAHNQQNQGKVSPNGEVTTQHDPNRGAYRCLASKFPHPVAHTYLPPLLGDAQTDCDLPTLNHSSVLVVNHIKAMYELCEIEITSGVTAEFRA
jgi:hypothetical protein